MRQKIVAGNWKMNMDYPNGISLFSEIINIIKDEVRSNHEVVICTPYIHINSIAQLSKPHSKVSVGAQNCHQAEAGAYTGEISASMIRSAGATHVIIGHSERRQYFVEDDTLLAEKTNMALKNGLIVLFCFGETLKERNENTHFEVIKRQLELGIFHLSEAEIQNIILAYEPVWAIGTGLTASPEQAQEMHEFIRSEVKNQYDESIAEDISILYGGSCNAKNAPDLFAKPDIDGGLIGGASLKSRDFVEIIKALGN